MATAKPAKAIQIILLFCILIPCAALYVLLMDIDEVLEYFGYVGALLLGLIVLVILVKLFAQSRSRFARFVPILVGAASVLLSWYFLFRRIKDWTDHTREVVIKVALALIAVAAFWLFRLSMKKQ
jgi:hypothetical protein